MDKLRKSIVLNVDAGWQFREGGFTVFLERIPHSQYWNYTVSRSSFHPKDRFFDGAAVAHHVRNAQYSTRKDAIESARDWISLNTRQPIDF